MLYLSAYILNLHIHLQSQRMDLLSEASDAVSDMDLVGKSIMGQDPHWELLPAQAAFSCRVGMSSLSSLSLS
jgi:hypothetical protein